MQLGSSGSIHLAIASQTNHAPRPLTSLPGGAVDSLLRRHARAQRAEGRVGGALATGLSLRQSRLLGARDGNVGLGRPVQCGGEALPRAAGGGQDSGASCGHQSGTM